MNVIVDTSVWSLALRRNRPNDAIAIVSNVVADELAAASDVGIAYYY